MARVTEESLYMVRKYTLFYCMASDPSPHRVGMLYGEQANEFSDEVNDKSIKFDRKYTVAMANRGTLDERKGKVRKRLSLLS